MKEMTTQANKKVRLPSRKKEYEQPLIRALISQSHRRGESLAELAKHLGVTYERLSQWRRNPSAIANANENVFINAANYLGIPIVLTMIMASRLELHQFVWPAAGTLEDRVSRRLEELRQDPFLGGFVPKELADAPLAVKLFIAFLLNQLGNHGSQVDSGQRWLNTLQQAVCGQVLHRAHPDNGTHSTAGNVAIFYFTMTPAPKFAGLRYSPIQQVYQ